MSPRTLLAALAALTLASPALAEITVTDAYVRAAMPGAPSAAAFMIINNSGAEDDRLISVSSSIAEQTELHTHMHGADGVMKMVAVEDGFVIPAGGTHALERGGDHVMFMGLKQPLENGQSVILDLNFEKAGVQQLTLPVDLKR